MIHSRLDVIPKSLWLLSEATQDYFAAMRRLGFDPPTELVFPKRTFNAFNLFASQLSISSGEPTAATKLQVHNGVGYTRIREGQE